MTKFPKLALAGALLAGASGLAFVAPADAAKKDKAAAVADTGLHPSPDVLKAAQAAQPLLQAGSYQQAEPLVQQMETAAKTDDDKYLASQFRLQVEVDKLKASGAKDESPLKAPLEALIANPRTPPDKLASYTFERGQIAFEQNKNAEAIPWLTKAQQLGYKDANLNLEIARARIDSGDTKGGLANLDATISQLTAAGQPVPEDYYKFALSQSYKSGDKATTMAWLKRYLVAYPTSKNWRDAIVLYALQPKPLATLDKRQQVDLFRLMLRAHAMDQYAYDEYAQKVLDLGLPDESKTVVTAGRAAGAIPATGGDGAAILADANKGIGLEGSLSALETKAKASANGSLAAQTGDAYLGKNDYAKAIELYRLALSKGGVKTDEVNTHLGIALAGSGDKEGAKAAFGQVQGAPRSDIAGFWTLYLDHPPTAA